MIKIKYKLARSITDKDRRFLYLSGIENGSRDKLTLQLEGVGEGVVSLGNITAPISNSIAQFDYAKLPLGIALPKISSGGSFIPATALIKTEYGISRAPHSSAELDLIALRCSELFDMISDLGLELGELSQKIKGHEIFNFIEERKNK